MIEATYDKEAESFLEECRAHRLKLAVAESCTGGLIAAVLTAIPGSSDVLDRGFVTYSNAAKMDMLGVSPSLLERHGAVSAEVAEAMVLGVLKNSTADVALGITGIAGPGGATETKPVGLVYIAAAQRAGKLICQRFLFSGDRAAVRSAGVLAALNLCRRLIGDKA